MLLLLLLLLLLLTTSGSIPVSCSSSCTLFCNTGLSLLLILPVPASIIPLPCVVPNEI
jgi:hypothetical protein